MDIIQLATSRHTCKAYDASRKIPQAQLDQLLCLLRNSPSSVNSQPWHFFVVGSDEGKNAIEPAIADFNRARTRNASHVIVFAVRTAQDDAHLLNLLEQEALDGRFPDGNARKMQDGGRRFFVDLHRKRDLVAWESRQAYLALGFLLLGAASLGIDATPIEGFDADAMDKALHLKEKGLTSVVVACLGYRSAEDFNAALPKSRLTAEQIFTSL